MTEQEKAAAWKAAIRRVVIYRTGIALALVYMLGLSLHYVPDSSWVLNIAWLVLAVTMVFGLPSWVARALDIKE